MLIEHIFLLLFGVQVSSFSLTSANSVIEESTDGSGTGLPVYLVSRPHPATSGTSTCHVGAQCSATVFVYAVYMEKVGVLY